MSRDLLTMVLAAVAIVLAAVAMVRRERGEAHARASASQSFEVVAPAVASPGAKPSEPRGGGAVRSSPHHSELDAVEMASYRAEVERLKHEVQALQEARRGATASAAEQEEEPHVETEEERAESARKSMEAKRYSLQKLEAAFLAQPRDPDWAQGEESRVDGIVTSEIVKERGGVVVSRSCRTTMCRVVLAPGLRTDNPAVISLLTHHNGYMAKDPDTEPEPATVVYIMREGVELPPVRL